jgi:hypothetical protein
MPLGMKYIYSDGQNWVVRNIKYSLKTKAFRFSKFGCKEDALQEAIKYRDYEEAKIQEIENGQIVEYQKVLEENKKLKEQQEADYKRLLEKEKLELIEKRKKIDAEESAAWVASEQAYDAKIWSKVNIKDNFDYWKEKYPEEAATKEGMTLVRDGYIAAGIFGSHYIPSVDNIQKGYLSIVALQKQVDKGVKLTIANVFKKNQIISYSK